MGRITINVSDELESRINALALELGSKSAVFLAALSVYRTDIPMGKKKAKASPKKKPTETKLGTGNRPKGIKEVEEFFRGRGVPEPVAPKAKLFFDHYESVGWRVGNRVVTNWGACLTTWQQNHGDWRPIPQTNDKIKVSMDAFLKWEKKEHPEWYAKHRLIENIGEVDEFYIEQYRNNNS
jgi:hypothetical protein